MNWKYLIAATVLAGIIDSAPAQIIAPTNRGDLFRAEAMIADENFLGTLDQLALIAPAALTPLQAEQEEWIRCRAMAYVDTDEAASLLNRFIANYGSSSVRFKAIMLLGDCLLKKSPAEALTLYNKVDEKALTDEESSELAYHKAYALLMLGQTEKAESLFEQAGRMKKWRARADFYLGYIAYTRHDYDRAVKFLDQTDRRSAPGSSADFFLAQIYHARGDYQKALRAAQSVMERRFDNPEYDAEATRVAGEALFQMGNQKEALSTLRRYIGMTPTPARSSLYILGTSAFNSGKSAEAIDFLQKVTGDDDAMAQSAYLFLGQAFLARGDRDAALLAFDNALKMDHDLDVQETAFYNYAVAKFGGARIPFGSSVATFEEFLSRYPNSKYAPEVQEYIVEGYLTDANYDSALASINRMTNPSAKVLDTKQKVLYALGSHSLTTGNIDRAVGYLREARAMSRDKTTTAQAALALGEALARKGQHKEAVENFNSYLTDAPSNDVNRAIAHYDLAYSYFALKDYAKADKNFSQLANTKNMDNGDMQSTTIQVDIYNRLADSKLYLGQYGLAAKYYNEAYDLQPSSGDYPLFQTAVIKGYERKHKEKIEILSKLLEQFPSSSLVPDALLEMTESYIQLGDNNSAIATYRRLVAEFPGTEQGRRGYLQMALTLLNSGRRAEAITAYKDIVALYPSSEEARMAIDELKRIYADDASLPEFAAWLRTVDGAPQLDIAEADRLTYESAEKEWITEHDAQRLEAYLLHYPDGAFRVRALGYLTDNAVEKGNHRDVVDFAAEIIERYPDSSQAENALYAKGNAENALGLSDDALATWSALEQRASSPMMLNAARAGIMRSARDIADHERVIAAADALLASSTLGSGLRNEAQFARAYALSQTGREADAVAIWEDLAQHPSDLYGAKSAYYLAEYLFNNGQTVQARRQVEALIDSGTPHSYWLARGFILLSDILANEGKDFEAREYLKSLRDNYPGTEPDIFQMIDSRLNK